MSTISNFDSVSVGSNFLSSVQIYPIRGHEHDGIMVQFFDYTAGLECEKFLQLRKKENYYCLFMSEYYDVTLPEFWQDSELILNFVQPNQKGE